MFQLIPTLRENSCAKPVLRANLWVKFRYSGIGYFGVWNLFLGIRNEITWSAPEHTFSHYFPKLRIPQPFITYAFVGTIYLRGRSCVACRPSSHFSHVCLGKKMEVLVSI